MPVLDSAARVEFQPNTNTWYTNGDLEAGAVQPFALAGLAGQQVTVWLSTTPASEAANLYAGLAITGADGQSFLMSPEQYWSTVLPVTQDYRIEVRSLGQQAITYQIVVKKSPTTIDPALGEMYELFPETVCQDLRLVASEALSVEFAAQTRAPFFDALGGEAGQGCHLGVGGNGTQFNSPQDVITILAGSVGAGWTEQPAYQADGPTGASTALARDMALMLISANWQPEIGATCPADRPISECSLTPEQKIYTIDIDIAVYKADFSLDGHWENAETNFNLDLYQDWKSIYGTHTVVANGGSKIDSMDVSINGILQGKVVNLQFQSSFTADPCTAQITYIDVNTIQWKIIDPPDGEYYLPMEATLTRK
ncbi:MAG: hypothetical protein HY835_10520 [Anaerolineae bacterium]|nr:hypothetical protein [Anaerolineae bacterium]